ncbi:MAG: radical SAM family heme chaperone HemW [Candidatus Omnitrophica bacterium]|nr:radical SAM family heme chaperone HemW [Candidatus Omnitrophota bacterium]
MNKTSLYIHIPFCEKKCFYCSFVVSIAQQHRIENYLRCLDCESKNDHAISLETIYVGGGTPTLLNSLQLKNLAASIRKNFNCSTVKEFTIEANPEGIDLEKAKCIFDLGVNRISLGMQTFNDQYLKYLGRCHDARQSLMAFDTFRRAGFQNINIDLMYSFPQQTSDQIKEDIYVLKDFRPEHVSLYTLNVEPYSRFHAQKIKPPSSDLQIEHYHLVVSELERLGYSQYEISNFSIKNRESLHNQNYWRGGNYIGLGVGAHGHVDGKRTWNVSRLTEYISRIEQGLSAEEGQEILNSQMRFNEVLLFGLRMKSGVDVEELKKRFSQTFTSEQEEKIQNFIKNEFLVLEKDCLRATPAGMLVLDEISAHLI